MSLLETSNRQYKTSTLISYSLTSMAFGLMVNVVMGWFLYFYENVVLLPAGFIFAANTIFTIWDAFNDIVAGVVTDRPYKKLIKRGQRYPWILISSIPFAFISIVLFTPPSIEAVGNWVVFFYFLIMLLIYDTLLSFWTVTYAAISSDKYRSPKDRTILGAWSSVFGTLGGVGGAVLASAFIVPTVPSTFVTTVAIFSGIGLLVSLISLPGVRDSKEMLARAQRRLDSGDLSQRKGYTEFFKIMKNGFKDPNFVALMVLVIGNSVVGASFAASLPYFAEFVMGIEKELVGAIVFNVSLPYTILGIVSVPIITIIANRMDYHKLFKISLIILPITLLLFYLVKSIIVAMIVSGLFGISASMFGLLMVPVRSDLNDEASLRENKRIDATYGAINVFFSQGGQWIFALTLWLTHSVFTDYDPQATTQSAAAQQGILAHFALVPAICFLIGAIIFIKKWNITKSKAEDIRLKLQDIQI